VLREFTQRWPAVDLRIAPEYTSAPTTAVREGALDIAIVHRVTAHRQIQFDPLFDDELVVVVPTGHRLARRPFATAEDFTDEHLIVYSTPADRIAILHDVLEPAGVVPARLTRIQLTEAIVQLVSAGMGVSVLARWAALPWIRSGELQAVRLTERGYARHWFVATRREQPAPAYQFDLMELLRRQLAGGPLPRMA
jgi:LysR family transcriptional regulator for metE and metH